MKKFARYKPLLWVIIIILIVVIIKTLRRANLNSQNKDSLMNNNVKAFLKMIRFAEGTAGENGYRVVYSYEKVLQNLSDHPHTTGEWKGKVLSDTYCKNAGLGPGCKSTAAGAYQITITTWRNLKKTLSLPDFSPNSQDLAAIELIREKGALKDIESGKIEAAIYKVRKIWASIPGNSYGQPNKKLSDLLTVFRTSGGNFA